MWGNIIGFIRPSVDEHIINQILGLTEPRLLTTKEVMDHYGDPADPSNITLIETPYPMRIAWDTRKQIRKLQCHKKAVLPLLNVFNDLQSAYGYQDLKNLGIDLFGGMYNFRPQRGLENKYQLALKKKDYIKAYTYLSRHSWGTAIDLDPARNQLKTKAPKAQFSRPEYKQMIDIFYSRGFISYGVERNNDWMHFELGIKT